MVVVWRLVLHGDGVCLANVTAGLPVGVSGVWSASGWLAGASKGVLRHNYLARNLSFQDLTR